MRKAVITGASVMLIFAALVPRAKAAEIDHSTYRIAISHDGNCNDRDDILAAPMALALVAEAGVQDKFVHMDYSNHIWGDANTQADDMRTSVQGAAEKWGLGMEKIFEVRVESELQQAIENFRKEGNASSENNRLYYACGGPMHVPWLCIDAVDPDKRQYITAISHAGWNDRYQRDGSKTWDDIKTVGCETIHIGNQNYQIWNDDDAEWMWFRDKGGKYEWVFDQKRTGSFDASDAGMVWYIITGRGDQKAIMSDVQQVFSGTTAVRSSVRSFAISSPAGMASAFYTPAGRLIGSRDRASVSRMPVVDVSPTAGSSLRMLHHTGR